MTRFRTKPGVGQESFALDGPLKVPEQYDLERAKQIAKNRKERIRRSNELRDRFIDEAKKESSGDKINKAKRVAQVGMIKGFYSRTDGGLFVPSSGTENTAICNSSLRQIRSDREAAVDRVREKYENDDSVSEKQVEHWAYFAGIQARKFKNVDYRVYRNSASVRAAWLYLHLQKPENGGEITRDAFDYQPDYQYDTNTKPYEINTRVVAYRSVLRFLMDTEAFAVLHPDTLVRKGKGEYVREVLGQRQETDYEYRRGWPVMKHTHKYRERMNRADDYMQRLTDNEFALTVEEALYSHWSRNIFWIRENNMLDDMNAEKWRNVTEPEAYPIAM